MHHKLSSEEKKSRRSWYLNAGHLVGKQECYLCAVHWLRLNRGFISLTFSPVLKPETRFFPPPSNNLERAVMVVQWSERRELEDTQKNLLWIFPLLRCSHHGHRAFSIFSSFMCHTDPSFSSYSSWILGIVVQKLTTRLVFIYLCSLSPRCWKTKMQQKVCVQRFQWGGKKSINRENNPHLRPEVDSNWLPSDLLSNQSDRRWFSFLWTLMPKKMDRG